MKFIEDMKERPEEERLAFSVMIAGAVAIILFLIWGATFFTRGNNVAEVDTSNQGASVSEGLRDIGNEVSAVANEFSAQYNQLKQALDEAGLDKEPRGVNTVELSIDDNGDVQVGNIVVEESEITEE